MATPNILAEGHLESAIITSLLALGIDHDIIDQRRKITNKGFFTKIDQKMGNQILFYLFTHIDPLKSTKNFRDCWPPLDKRQEAQFRSISQKWFKELRLNEELYPKMSEVASISAVNTSHPRFKETIFILTCIALHSVHSGSSRHLHYCPRFTLDNGRNRSCVDLLKGLKLFHSQNYIKISKVRQGNLQALRDKAREMTKYYQYLISEMDSLEEENARESPAIKNFMDTSNSKFEKDITALVRLKNEEMKTLWSSIDVFRKKEEAAWPKISALTNSTSGGLTNIDGKMYSTPLVGTKCFHDRSKPLMRDGKLDLVSLFSHSSSAIKILIAKAKEEQRKNLKASPVTFSEERLCVTSLGENLKEVKIQIESVLPPLSDSVTSLRERVDKHSTLFESNSKELTFCPPTPNYYSKSGQTPKLESLPHFRLLNLSPDVLGERDLHRTPTGSKSFNKHLCRGNISRNSINEMVQVRANRWSEEKSPFLPFQNAKEPSLNSPMQCFNKILDTTKKYMKRRSSSHPISRSICVTPSSTEKRITRVDNTCNGSTLSGSDLSSDEPTLLPSENDEEEFKGALERMSLLDESHIKVNTSPLVSRIITEIETSQKRNESKFCSFVREWKKDRSHNITRKDPDTNAECVSKLPPRLVQMSKERQQQQLSIHDGFSSLLSSFELKLDEDFNFEVKASSKDLLDGEKCEDEVFMSPRDFEKYIDTNPSRASLLPKNSLFDTLTEAVLVGEVDPSVIFNENFDYEIRRESISKRESIMSLHSLGGFGSQKRNADHLRLSTEMGFLLDDSGSCLLSASFDSD